MGKSRVAVCVKPERLIIDGKNVRLSDGMTIVLPDGADVTRRGNAYVIRGARGDSVRAELNAPGYINVTVGLGRWPTDVRGLLANANGDVNQLATREGRTLRNPFSFEELYHPYADSWRVRPRDSLVTACGERVRSGAPNKPFFAKDLKPDVERRAQAICTKAGAKKGPLLDACIIDVTVIGTAEAAKVLAGTNEPVAVGQVK